MRDSVFEIGSDAARSVISSKYSGARLCFLINFKSKLLSSCHYTFADTFPIFMVVVSFSFRSRDDFTVIMRNIITYIKL